MRGSTRLLSAALLLSASIVAPALFTGCGQAEAEPLEVTYYYLPG